MRRKPIIGVTSSENTLFETDNFAGVPASYTLSTITNAIIQAGGIPMIIPIHESDMTDDYVHAIDGLVLSGGVDVNPEFYGEQPAENLAATDPARDAREFKLIKAATQQHKPILGICRGMQIMNVYMGGTLIQDINSHQEQTLAHELLDDMEKQVHGVAVEKHSRFYHLLANIHDVNSVHHQAIKKLGKDLKVAATAYDGVIEAIESVDENIDFFGVQFHPESLVNEFPEYLTIFEDIVERATHSTNIRFVANKTLKHIHE